MNKVHNINNRFVSTLNYTPLFGGKLVNDKEQEENKDNDEMKDGEDKPWHKHCYVRRN